MNSNPKFLQFNEQLEGWQDPDIAAYKLACCLGIIPKINGEFLDYLSIKGLFWAANPLGDSLYRILEDLSDCKVLEFDEENYKYRWNKKFEI